MSQIAGVWYFDGRPISGAEEEQAARALGGTDPGSLGAIRSAGLLMLSSLPDGAAVHPSGGSCVFEGRLDNRADLAARFGRNIGSNACLLLSATEALGPEGFREAVGDWSVVVADRGPGSLLLASDFAGTRPLYYQVLPDSTRWASSLSGLVRWTNVSEIDELYAAETIAGDIAGNRTPFRNIQAAVPGEYVRVTSRGAIRRLFWHPPVAAIRYQNDDDYKAHLETLFREAVRARMQGSSLVCSELSGGLDSSSVTCAATRLAAESRAQAVSVVTFSYAQPGSADMPYIAAVERHQGAPSVHIPLDRESLLSARFPGEGAPLLWGKRHAEAREQMRLLGSNVLLTGQLGDLIMGNWQDPSGEAADLLAEGSLSAGARLAFRRSRNLRTPVYPILWDAVLKALPWTRSHRIRSADGAFRLLSATLRRQFAQTRASVLPDWLRDASPGKRDFLLALSGRLSARALQTPECLGDVFYAHPFAHRPLLEFMAAIPASVVALPGAPRRLMRETFRALLPDAVWSRRSKATYDRCFLENCCRISRELFGVSAPILVVEFGWVDEKEFRAQIDRMSAGNPAFSRRLANILSLELWIRRKYKLHSSRARTVRSSDCFAMPSSWTGDPRGTRLLEQ